MYIISNNEFDLAYKIMETSFPKSELRTYSKLKQYFDEGKVVLYGIKHNEILTGVIMCWECDSCVFLENFAVNETARGLGIGSIILNDVKQHYEKKLIVLEVENPYDDMSNRRVGFYERNGFIFSNYGYMQPKINEEVNNIPLLLMSYPNELDKETFLKVKEDLFANVYMQK